MMLTRRQGIALYTYHKYRKALDSPVPLDAHGNPMEEEPLVGDANLELAETEHLAARMSMGRSRRDAVRSLCTSPGVASDDHAG
jgi:hypothetical protein